MKTAITLTIYRYRVTDKPDTDLALIAHAGETPQQVRQELLDRFGERLLSVTTD